MVTNIKILKVLETDLQVMKLFLAKFAPSRKKTLKNCSTAIQWLVIKLGIAMLQDNAKENKNFSKF